MAGSSGFAISIGIQDQASAGLDKLNKRIQALTAPAERFNKSLSKFGDVTGISRTTEGIQSLGDRGLEAARSIERLVSPLGILTSAATVGGIAALSKRWGEMGNTLAKTSYQLNASPGRLSELEGAARLAGSSASAMDNSLRGLGDTLNAAHWGRDPAAVATLNSLGIAFNDASGQARQAVDVLGDVADKVASYKDARAQTNVLKSLGMDEDMLPLLKNGREGLEKFTRQAQQTGSVMTKDMTENAERLNKSWSRLGLDVEGVGNRMMNDFSPTITRILTQTSDWIEKNQKLATSIAEIGAAILAIGTLKPAAWVMRLLGLGGLASAVGTTAVLASPLLLSGDTPSDPAFNKPYDPISNPNLFDRNGRIGKLLYPSLENTPRWLGGSPPAEGQPSLVRKADQDRAATVRDSLMRDLGINKDQAAGIVSNLWAESGLRGINEKNPIAGRGGFGWAQWTGPRRDTFEAYAASNRLDPSSDAANYGYLLEELRGGKYGGVMQGVRTAPSAYAAANAFFPYESGGDMGLESQRAGHVANAGVISGLNGRVSVDVNIKGAPAGTTATATASGAAMASPPRVETAMPGIR